MFRTKTKLWKYQTSKAAWHFLTIDKKITKKIKAAKLQKSRGWGSIRVNVTIGKTTWPTSIFPTKEGEYYLPVKVSVRRKEKIKDGDLVSVLFEPVLWETR
jgi:hypothetical protein